MSKKHKETVDRFIEEIRKTCYAMIEGERFCESPVAMVKESIMYLEEHYTDVKRERTVEQNEPGRFS